MVELGTLVAALATLATSLGGLQARVLQQLAGSNGAAIHQAVTRRRDSTFVRRCAGGLCPRPLQTADPSLPLRDRVGCRNEAPNIVSAGEDRRTDTASQTIKTIRGNAPTLRALRKVHLTAIQAGNAFARGFVSAC